MVLLKSRFVFVKAMIYLAASLGKSSECFLSPLFPAGFVLFCVVLCWLVDVLGVILKDLGTIFAELCFVCVFAW